MLCPECLAEFGAQVLFTDALRLLWHRATRHHPELSLVGGTIVIGLAGPWLWNQLKS